MLYVSDVTACYIHTMSVSLVEYHYGYNLIKYYVSAIVVILTPLDESIMQVITKLVML